MSNTPNLTDVLTYLESLQDNICNALTKVDGNKFTEDEWTREEGGGGRSRVLRNGSVFEQAGVNFSRVSGDHLPKAATTQRPDLSGSSFEAAGVSLVLHPNNPMCRLAIAMSAFFLLNLKTNNRYGGLVAALI